ncbi:MAG TPA: acetyl ornithine aminotransferase family protein [Acidobacteriaceae bacterium]|jgi:4-aminobutyrate aminotransferase
MIAQMEGTLHVASAEAHARFGPQIAPGLPGPRARKMIAADEEVMSPSYTRCYPLAIKRGYGCNIEDVDGNRFLDLTAGIAVNSTGHCHPEVVKAIQDQAAQLIHMSGTDFYYDLMPQVAGRLSEIAPMPGPHRVFFTNSGAEAVECALKLARYHTGRQNIISFFGSFHGRTMGALSLTGSKVQQKRRFGPFVPGVTHVRYPDTFREGCGSAAEREALGLECARFLENKLFKTTLPPEEVAAVFVEPIQGEGGYIVPPDSFLQELRRICDRHGILLVADEIQSGAGRTGKWWAIEHANVQPDILLSAKGIASGMPIGVCLAKAEVMNWVPGSHGSTFSGNPLCLASAMATMNIIAREGMANAAAVGAKALQRLEGWREQHEVVGDVRGRGLMIGVELVAEKHTRKPAGALRDLVVDLAFQRGLLLLGCGESTIRLCPPLIISQNEMDVALDILEECLVAATHS